LQAPFGITAQWRKLHSNSTAINMADESDAKLKNQQLNEIGTEILSWFLA
jgi:hypothetical protein